MKYAIRLEQREDYNTVELLTRKAFWKDEDFKSKGLGCDEHYLAHCLRTSPEFIQSLNFVIETEKQIVANIMYTHAYVEDAKGVRHSLLSFGPVSVLPEYQKQGLGSTIIKHSLQVAKELGFKAVIIYGHPEYYPRFGFKEASLFDITTADGNNFPAFMALELESGSLNKIKGEFILSPVYTIDHSKALEFDKNF
ncbi:MAG: N-acetyltransferase [Candidatus Zophobacter franzmannii]|jgi:predicted N-acetyltransferase YhbS|nr:N-acetyltransferase [Candidatus Zophobacter franzmannii]